MIKILKYFIKIFGLKIIFGQINFSHAARANFAENSIAVAKNTTYQGLLLYSRYGENCRQGHKSWCQTGKDRLCIGLIIPYLEKKAKRHFFSGTSES